MSRTVNVGIIGCGGIANGKHMPALSKLSNVKLVAFCDIIVERAEEAIEKAYANDENDEFVNDYEQALKAVADGTTITGVKVYELIDTSEVTVNFGGYSSDIEDTQIMFEIESRASDEWKAVLEQQAADLEAKQNMTGFDFDCVSGEIDKDNGWYVDVMDDEDVELCLTDTDATLTVYSDPDRESAQQWAEFKASGFQKGAESLENRTIGNANYILFPVNDTQFMLFADCSQGGAVMIYGMFTDLDQCMTQLEKIVVK